MTLKRIHDTSRYSMNMLTPNLSVRAFLEKNVEKQLQLCWGRLVVYNPLLTSSGYLTKEIMALVSVTGPNFRRIHITETELQWTENPWISLLYFYTSHLKYSLFWFLCVFCNVILITQQKNIYKIVFSLMKSSYRNFYKLQGIQEHYEGASLQGQSLTQSSKLKL